MFQKTNTAPAAHKPTTNVRSFPELLEKSRIYRGFRWLSQVCSLPNDWVSFAMFAIVLSLLCGGLILHIQLSSQILRMRLEIGQMQIAYDQIEHQNSELIWQISRYTSLNDLHQRAEALGYAPSTQQYYVAAQDIRSTQWFASAPSDAEPRTVASLTTPTAADPAPPIEFSDAAPKSPEWTVRVQQRMADIGAWLQRPWQH